MIASPSEGARSKQVDKVLVEEFLGFLRHKTPDDELIRFLVGFGRRVLLYYGPGGAENVKMLGYNQADVVLGMRQLVLITLNTVRSYLSMKSEDKRVGLLAEHNYRTIKEFERDMHTVLGLFLDSEYHTVTNHVVADIRDEVGKSTAEVLSESSLLEAMFDFYTDNYFKSAARAKSTDFADYCVNDGQVTGVEGEYFSEVEYRSRVILANSVHSGRL